MVVGVHHPVTINWTICKDAACPHLGRDKDGVICCITTKTHNGVAYFKDLRFQTVPTWCWYSAEQAVTQDDQA